MLIYYGSECCKQCKHNVADVYRHFERNYLKFLLIYSIFRLFFEIFQQNMLRAYEFYNFSVEDRLFLLLMDNYEESKNSI